MAREGVWHGGVAIAMSATSGCSSLLIAGLQREGHVMRHGQGQTHASLIGNYVQNAAAISGAIRAYLPVFQAGEQVQDDDHSAALFN